MAKQAVAQRDVSIRQACRAFSVSETCYRYEPKMADENALGIWLMLCLFAQCEAVSLES